MGVNRKGKGKGKEGERRGGFGCLLVWAENSYTEIEAGLGSRTRGRWVELLFSREVPVGFTS